VSTTKIGGIYRGNRKDQRWILEWPEPLGVTFHLTLRRAMEVARKNGLTPKRWANCDAL
jgi:hypothetical protein